MLTGPELGAALKEAMRRKKVTQQQVANEFGIKQPSVSEWQRFGRIGKEHVSHLVTYFADVAGPDHWGLSGATDAPPPRHAPAAAPHYTLADALATLSAALAALPSAKRAAAVDLCATLARAPDSSTVRRDLAALLGSVPAAPTWRDCAEELVTSAIEGNKQLPPADEIIQLVDALYIARSAEFDAANAQKFVTES